MQNTQKDWIEWGFGYVYINQDTFENSVFILKRSLYNTRVLYRETFQKFLVHT